MQVPTNPSVVPRRATATRGPCRPPSEPRLQELVVGCGAVAQVVQHNEHGQWPATILLAPLRRGCVRGRLHGDGAAHGCGDVRQAERLGVLVHCETSNSLDCHAGGPTFPSTKSLAMRFSCTYRVRSIGAIRPAGHCRPRLWVAGDHATQRQALASRWHLQRATAWGEVCCRPWG